MFPKFRKSTIFAGFGLAAAICGLSASSALATTVSSTFGVSANVPNNCTIAATSLNFGAYNAADLPATNSVSVICTNTTPYNVALNQGTGTGATTTTRILTGTTPSNTLQYHIYQNSGHTTNWGNTIGTDTQTGTGTGSVQDYTGYGLIPAGQTILPDTYSDTITASVIF